VLGVLGAVASFASHGAIDRLIRGRIWIGVIAFALIGIVTLQLLVLQLNANVGRALVREAQLQRENTGLSIEDSELAGGERVEAKAGRLGMQLVPVGSLRFLTSYPPADLARAAAALGIPVHAGGAGSAGNSTATAAASGEVSGAPASTAASAEGSEATGSTGEAQQSSEQAQGAGQFPAGETSAASSPQAATSATGESAPTQAATAPATASSGAAGGTEPTGSG
jgi:cell division protein FtsL